MQEKHPVAGAIYQHYKGKMYRVIGVGKHSETLEDVVLYEALYDNPLGRLWSRPLGMWSESVIVNGQEVPRFKFLFK
ncbi:MAG: DUF1653 domain-containing protein [Bdellovibrio sp.]